VLDGLNPKRLAAWQLAWLLAGSLTWPAVPTWSAAQEPSRAALPDTALVAEFARQFDLVLVAVLGPAPSFAEYVGYALGHSRRIVAAQQEWLAAIEGADGAGALPDPRFGFTEFLVPVETRVGPQLRSFALFQTIPWFGKLSLQGKVEQDAAAAAAARLQAALLQVRTQVHEAYFELVHLAWGVRVTAEHQALLVQWEEVARARYETAAGSYADLVKAQVELGRTDERLRELEDRFRPLAARLNAALDRPGDTPVPRPGEPADGVADGSSPADGSLDESVLQGRLLLENPELVALDHLARRYRHAGELAGKQGGPDLTLGLQYIQTGPARIPDMPDSGQDPVLAHLSFNIPLWRGKYGASRREADGRYAATLSARQEMENDLAAALTQALFAHRDALRKIDLYAHGLLPKGRQSLTATQAAYEAGEAGYLDLVDAQRALLEFELSFARATADRSIALARIEQVVGGPVASETRE